MGLSRVSGTSSDPTPAEKPGGAVPKGAFRDCPECPEMLAVPAGAFTMGSPQSERDRDGNEGPQRQVTIAKPFALGKYPVTFDEYDACAAAGGCGHRPLDNGWGRGRQPAVHVSWEDAKAYVAWLARKSGKPYRLPSEAEWEYAAGAGTTTRYFWGDEVGRGRAACAGCGSQWDGKQPAPVGSFAANAFSLLDMHGNVEEWSEDCWHESYRGAPADGSAWLQGGRCAIRVTRDGSWVEAPRYLRSSRRNSMGNLFGNTTFSGQGPRVARDLD